MRDCANPNRYSGRGKHSSPERDAHVAVRWLVRIENEHRRPGCSPMRARPDTVAAALAWWQLALRLGNRRHGRHYARQVRDAAIETGLVIDTGCVDTPQGARKFSPSGRSRWWPIYIIKKHLKTNPGHFTYWPQTPGHPGISSLCSDRIRQALRKRSRPAYGSVQAAFRATGPP